MVSLTSSSPKPLRILIADDHPLFRDGLRRLLESEAGFEVVGEGADGEEILAVARNTSADLLLLDLSMPRRGGMEVLRELAAANIPLRTLLLTAAIDKSQIVQALKLGAYGVILKESTTQQLFESIRAVMAGQFWIGRESVSDVVRALRGLSAPAAGGETPKDFGLTRRELEIVAMIIAGYSNPDIAQRCSISEQTVKHHVSNIFNKLGVSNRLELALFAVNHRLTDAISRPPSSS
jgi:DNA-binding NarL/FixJ family response regulator